VDQSDAPPPSVSKGFVVRPEFRCGWESFFGSYAFVVESELSDSPLLITALHVMDELIKGKNIDCSSANASYTGDELPSILTRVNLYDVFVENWAFAPLGSAGSMVSLPDARLGEEEPYCQRDIAAFRLDRDASVCPGKLAGTPTEVGEAVWLVANPARSTKVEMMSAVVVESNRETFVYRLAAGTRDPRSTSGAPLVNCKGEVAGINIGIGWFQGNHFGHANNATSIRNHLRTVPCRNAALR